jgi:hypothetical protein
MINLSLRKGYKNYKLIQEKLKQQTTLFPSLIHDSLFLDFFFLMRKIFSSINFLANTFQPSVILKIRTGFVYLYIDFKNPILP